MRGTYVCRIARRLCSREVSVYFSFAPSIFRAFQSTCLTSCRQITVTPESSSQLSSSRAPTDLSLLSQCEVLSDAVDRAKRNRSSVPQTKLLFTQFVRSFPKFEASGELVLPTSCHSPKAKKDAVQSVVLCLAALSEASTLFASDRQAAYSSSTSFLDTQQDSDVSFCSPYVAEDDNDVLAAWLRDAALCCDDATTMFELLTYAVQLEIGDPDTLHTMARALCQKSWVQAMTPSEVAQTLHIISVCFKRKKITVPSLDNLLVPITQSATIAKFSQSELIMILSTIVRLKDRKYWDATRLVSRKLASFAPNFSNRDIIYSLRAVAYADGCSELFAAAVLEACAAKCSTFSTKELGDVCKLIRGIHLSRGTGHLTTATCGKEVRRLLPMLLSRANELLGEFSLRDARAVLECMEAFRLKHSIVFAQLTRLVS